MATRNQTQLQSAAGGTAPRAATGKTDWQKQYEFTMAKERQPTASDRERRGHAPSSSGRRNR